MATIHASTFAANDDPLRKRVLCDGTLLVGNQAVNLVGAPGARKITNQIHSIVKSLKPHILQAPESNDRDAQEQAARTRLHAFLVENTANRLNNFETIKPDEYTAALLMLIQQLHDGLDGTHAELQDLYDQQGVVKFACQSEIKRRLDKHREESRERVIQFCFESILLMNHAIAQSYADVHLVGRQFDDVKLNYDTKFEWLEREVSAMRSARRTDERCSAMCIALERNVFFLV